MTDPVVSLIGHKDSWELRWGMKGKDRVIFGVWEKTAAAFWATTQRLEEKYGNVQTQIELSQLWQLRALAETWCERPKYA